MKNQKYIIALSLFIVSASWGMNDQVKCNITLLTPEMRDYVNGVYEDIHELKHYSGLNVQSLSEKINYQLKDLAGRHGMNVAKAEEGIRQYRDLYLYASPYFITSQ